MKLHDINEARILRQNYVQLVYDLYHRRTGRQAKDGWYEKSLPKSDYEEIKQQIENHFGEPTSEWPDGSAVWDVRAPSMSILLDTTPQETGFITEPNVCVLTVWR